MIWVLARGWTYDDACPFCLAAVDHGRHARSAVPWLAGQPVPHRFRVRWWQR